MKLSSLLTIALALSLFSCASPGGDLPDHLDGFFKEEYLRKDILTLSSDEFEGRGVASRGEEKTLAYLEKAFRSSGLEPGGENGTFFQNVPLVGTMADTNMTLKISGPEGERRLKYMDEFMAWTKRETESIEASGDLLFVGYGTVAPEFQWDDYKGVDCTGKVLVMLVNDPPLEDVSRFNGKAMTYYGRWTYKYEIGAKLGAAGVILIHQTERAGYPWEVVSGSWGGSEQFDMEKENGGEGSVMPFESWVPHPVAGELFQMAGLDLAEMEERAARDDFEPVEMNLSASIAIKNKIRRIHTKNVIGILPGSHPQKSNEYIIYTAHWDHLGVGTEVNGDRIYNGALDNATGTAAIVSLARAFHKLPKRPDRSLIFLAVTAEEQGLLGSRYYAANPLYPLNRTVAVINIDGCNMYGATRDIVVIGLGNSTLDDLAREAGAEQDRYLVGDPEPQKGFFYRSDHFSFAKEGVPALYAESGVDYIGQSAEWGQKQRDDYTRNRYHKPQDEFLPTWSFDGLIQDLVLWFRVGYLASQNDDYPEWNEGTEFKAVREASLNQP